MMKILCNLLSSLSSQWNGQQQEHYEEQHEEQREDAEQANLHTEAAIDNEGNTQEKRSAPRNEGKKPKTVTIQVPSEEGEHRRPTDDIMKCIDQIADGELTRAELERITGALRRKLKEHSNKHGRLSPARKSFTQTPSKVVKVNNESNYFLNDGSSNFSMFADISQQQQGGQQSDISSIYPRTDQQHQQTANFTSTMFKYDSISTIKPRDDEDDDDNEGKEEREKGGRNSYNEGNDNEISAIEPVRCEGANKAFLSGPIRRNRRRNHVPTVPWAKKDCLPPPSSIPSQQQQQDFPMFSSAPAQMNLFGFQSDPQAKQEGEEDKRSFSDALDEIYKKRTGGDEPAKLYDFDPDHRAPSPMKEHPLTQCDGAFSSLEPILK